MLVFFLLERIRFAQLWILAVIIFKECSAQINFNRLGFGYRYSGTPHNTSQCRTSSSLRSGADPDGGILTLV